ncbi:hypothetical protein BGW42_008449 [Actinomortierella wolfii]|nr:hypothetical protein BGW42_008449 [Actinomortierella wolfii]
MFCPRLDSALVASIYNDLGDFAECIPILSALAKAAISDDEDNGYDNVGQQSETRSITQSSSNSTSLSKNSKKQQQQKQQQQNTKAASSTSNKKINNKKGKGNNSKTSAANKQPSDTTSSATTSTTTTTTEEQISHHPLKEKILLWTESVAASQSDLAAPAQTKNKPSSSSSSSSSSTSSTVQYLPSPAPVQPLTAPAGFKGFKASETQVVSRSTLGSTLPSSSSTGTAATTTDTSATTTTNTPATRLKAVRNPNFVREVTPLEVPSASDDEDEDEDDEDDGFENGQSASNSGLVSSSSMASSSMTGSSGEVKKKKNRRSGRGRKDRKKREALRAEAEAAAVLSAFSALMTGASPSPPPSTLKSWKKDRGGGGRGRGQQQQQEMNEVAALLDSASRLSSVQLHRERQRQNGSQGVEEGSSKDGNSQDNDNDDDDDDDEDQGAHQAKNGDMDKLDAKRREQVSFLRSCFPDKGHSDDYLIQCLKESRWDIESAVELILSRMFLENEQVETSSSGSNLSRSTTDSYSSWTTVTSAGSKDDVLMYGTKQSGKQGKSNNSSSSRASAIASQRILQDTLGSAGHSSDILSNTLAGQDELLLPGPGNDWAAFEHQIQVLMTTFHTIPRKTIVATFHSNGANLIKTIEALEALQRSNGQPWMPLNREAVEASRQFDTKLAQLVEMFPGHAVSGLKKFLVYNEGNVQEAMNAILAAGFADEDLRPSALAMASSSSGSSHQTEYVPLPVDIRYKNDRNGTPIPASLLTEAPGQGGWSKSSLSQLPSTSNPFPQGVRAFPNTLLDHSNAELYNDEDDPVWCRQQASEALQQRNELFRKAAKAYQQAKGKGVGAGGIAAYYADEGKKFDAMGKKWHMRAARAVVQQHRLENNDPNLVDLHGLTISEAQTVVREAVTEWFARSTMQANRIAARPLRIVTGVGSHSKDRIARLYPSILSMLQKDGWRIETENGVILVKGVSRHVTTNRK